MRRGLLIIMLVLAARSASAAVSTAASSGLTGDAAVYYGRGHYWIELEIGEIGRTPPDYLKDPSRYTICPLEDGSSPFSPSKVEVSVEGGLLYAVLGSSRIKGKRCYRVVFAEGGPEERSFERVCDPMMEPAGDVEKTPGERIFEDWIAPALSASGDEYRLNRFSAAWDLEGERAVTELALEPVVEVSNLSVAPFFSYDRVTLKEGGSGDLTRREAGVSASAFAWAGGIRYRLEGGYSDRKDVSLESAGGDARSRDLSLMLAIRADNLFDRINRPGISAFKGVDLGLGWAWFDSTGSGGFAEELSAPLALARITWTLLAGLQLSYSAEMAGTDGIRGEFHAMHRFRARLMLRDALEPGGHRSYHPDLEFSVDAGRRPPFFLRERSVSLGFTFDLYPW